MKKIKKNNKKKSVEKPRPYTIQELIELGEKNDWIKVADTSKDEKNDK